MVNTQNMHGHLMPYAYENITVSNTPIGFTATKVVPVTSKAERDLGTARLVVVTVEDASIRFTVHGVDPDAGTTGHLIASGTILDFANLQTMLQFRAIRATATDAKLKVTYYR